MTWDTEAKRVISIYIPSTQPGPCKLFWRPVPTCPAITTLLNLDMRLSTLLPLHLTYAAENKVNICQPVMKTVPATPAAAWLKTQSKKQQLCICNAVADGLSDFDKTDETHRQMVLFSQLTAALHNALASANILPGIKTRLTTKGMIPQDTAEGSCWCSQLPAVCTQVAESFCWL